MSAPAIVVDQPGVYDMPTDVYLADPVPGGSLSSTGARMLVPTGRPAKFRYWADHPKPRKREFDLGHAAHRYILGAGVELAVCDYRDWRTNAAKAEREAAYEAGRTPILEHEHDQVLAMVKAFHRNEVASSLFHPGTGKPEQAIVWRDAETGVWCRALLDWLPEPTGQRFILRDYKTTDSIDREKFQRSLANFGYHVQMAFHLMGARALGLAGDDAQAVLVAQEKEPPHLTKVYQLDPVAMRIGHTLARDALLVYAQCAAAGEWPDYCDEVELISLPSYIENRYVQELYA